MDYFSLFDVPQQFDVDTTLLSARYQALQQLTHPDKFATASESEKRIAMQKNAQVNDAFRVLKDPILRAEHLLALRGVNVAHDQQSMKDTAFLMQQMEWRESLEDASATSDVDAMYALDDELQQHAQQLMSQLSAQLNAGTEERLQTAEGLIAKLKFMHKLRHQIDEQIDRLEEDY